MWDKRVILGWFLYLAIGAAFEIWTNFNGSPATPSLTDVTVRYLPPWLIMPILFWANVHFGIHYAQASKWFNKIFTA